MGATATARARPDEDCPRRTTIYELIAANKRRSWLLLASFAIPLAGLAAGVQAKWQSIPVTAVVMVWSVAMAAIVLAGYVDQAILARIGARPADAKRHAHFINCVDGLAIAAGIPPPRAFVITSRSLNAFAIGFKADRAVICATTGLLDRLDRLEVEGVVAHESAHIMCGDTQYATLAAYCVLLTQLLARLVLPPASSRHWVSRACAVAVVLLMLTRVGDCCARAGALGGLAILAMLLCLFAVPPLAPKLAARIQRGLHEERELLADANGALLCRYPKGLTTALEKIRQEPWIPRQFGATLAPFLTVNAEAVVNPGYSIWQPPSGWPQSPVEARIQRLLEM